MRLLDQRGTLYFVWEGKLRKIRTDPLSILLSTALQGHEGSYESMKIEMDSGQSYAGGEIRTLARRLNRKRWYWPF